MITLRVRVEQAVVREATFASLPVTLGRGVDCDFVLADPSVSRRHAVVEGNGEGLAVLRDLGSRNGVRVGTEAKAEVPLPRGATVRCTVGMVELELIAGAPELDTQELRAFSGAGRMAKALRPAGHLTLGLAGLLAWLVVRPDFWSPWTKDRGIQLLWAVVSGLVALPSLAFLLVALLRVVRRRTRVADALAAVCRLVWLLPLLTAAELAGYYVLSVRTHGRFATVIWSAAFVFAAVALAGLGRRHGSTRFRLAWALAVSLLVVAGRTASFLAHRQSGTPATEYVVAMPVAGITGPATDLETYLDDVRVSFERATGAAAEVRRRQDRSQGRGGEPAPAP